MSKSVCTHINHEHPALIVPCPACGEEWKYQIVHPSVLQTLHENISALERELEKVQSAIKDCSYGPCPTLAALAWEEIEPAPSQEQESGR